MSSGGDHIGIETSLVVQLLQGNRYGTNSNFFLFHIAFGLMDMRLLLI